MAAGWLVGCVLYTFAESELTFLFMECQQMLTTKVHVGILASVLLVMHLRPYI